ncbi:hypothetical protein [Luteimonas sp. 3794]|uniref:hypothetical protein n=1 Tax=Luteimonas sp. 3794 TaxID=2817730 RepID=UPI00285AE303|nr:hypothetical protein [Luteimonas sp. 3794]MDR6990666.1 hypothetical protein [Luteimonas sp. 3794]
MQTQMHRVESLLRRVAAEGGGTDAITAQAVTLWNDLGGALVPIIGERGMSALSSRALHLAGARHAWLRDALEAAGSVPAFPVLAEASSRQSEDDAIVAIADLFDTFERLLVTLIGASLSERLLHPLRDDPSDPPRQDISS